MNYKEARERERAEEAERQAFLEELAVKLARHLKGIWRVNQHETSKRAHGATQSVVIQNDRRRRLILQTGHYNAKGMMRVIGEVEYGGAINVSPKRAPRSIASDIERRLLPEFFEACEKRETADRQKEQKEREQGYRFEALRRLLPDLRPCRSSVYINTQWQSPDAGVSVGEGHDTRVTIQATGYEEIIAVCGFLTEYRKKRKHETDQN